MRGKIFTEKELMRIQSLLAETDMSFKDIATRMGCAKSSIVAVNRRLGVRQYNGCRTRWDLPDASECDYSESITMSM
jgi:hypothetical protein